MYKSKLYCTLSYLASTITGCVSISAFTSLVGILTRITSSTIGLKLSAISVET